MNKFQLRQLPHWTRLALALLLVLLALAYLALLMVTYFQFTSASSYIPTTDDLAFALFRPQKPVSKIERLLTSTAGEMNSGGTMRPAFAEQSTGWAERTERLSPDALETLLKERAGERLAMLDWIGAGASPVAYEQDDHPLTNAAAIAHLTAEYRRLDDASALAIAPTRVKIRTLINDRCVTCHSESGRHDTARFIELDSYERLTSHLAPEQLAPPGRPWLIAALLALFPYALLMVPLFAFTEQPFSWRASLIILTVIVLAAIPACWRTGPRAASILIAAMLTGIVLALVQCLACLQELLVHTASAGKSATAGQSGR
jgi:hypothetical protein